MIHPFICVIWLFVTETVLLSVLVLIVLSSVLHLIKSKKTPCKYQDILECFFDIFRLFLQGVISEPEEDAIRQFLMSVILAVMLIGCAYCSNWFTFFIIPLYERPIRTSDELVASGLQWPAFENYIFCFLTDSSFKEHNEYARKFIYLKHGVDVKEMAQ